MVFSSLLFLFAFLPLVMLAYYLTPPRFRNLTALAASYLFYAWGAPRFALVLLATSGVDYVISRRMSTRSGGHRKGLLAGAIAVNLSLLFYFKYANFAMEQFNALLQALSGQGPMNWTHVVLPIGISFFTFQKISYLVDVYRGEVEPSRSFFDYALYVALFPQLIAGPIVRYHDVNQQLRGRRHSTNDFFEGIWRFCLGLGKKVLIANPMSLIADAAFDNPLQIPAHYAWIGLVAYSLQIYFDFSGYSDMAIGLGRMMGFRFLENFNRPYIARNFTEFWRRWHISLSNWMREYLYIPLGGNRCKPGRVYFNLWVVFLLSGLWHGAQWNFVIWGAFHGGFLAVERMIGRERLARIPALLATPATFLLISLGWVCFRAKNLPDSISYIQSLFDGSRACPRFVELHWVQVLTPSRLLILGIALVISFAPDTWKQRLISKPLQRSEGLNLAFRLLVATLIFLLAWGSLANLNANPFIYFRF